MVRRPLRRSGPIACAALPRHEIAAIEQEKPVMRGRGFSGIGRSAVLAAAWLFIVAAPVQALDQTRNLISPQLTVPVPLTPGTGSSGATLVPIEPTQPAPASPLAQAVPMVPAGQVALAVSARYGRDAPAISGGLIWRVYAAKPDATGIFRLIKEDRAAAPTFMLPPGNYVVHADLGLASASKAVQLRAETVREVFEIPAGGIRLEGRVGDVRIPTGQISFNIFTGSQFDTTERRPLVQNVMTGDVVLLPEGTYYIVSNYGDGNSVVRSDVHMQAAKLTDIVVTHRAAVITLKLVNEAGGEVLAEGDYHVIARNEAKTYQRDFKVITGVDGEVEVLAR